MNTALDDIAAKVSQVLSHYDVSSAYLFGSFARGEQTENSDVDLRFVCGPSITYGTLLEISEQLEGELGSKIEIVTNPPEFMRPRFRERVLRDEVLLYEAA